MKLGGVAKVARKSKYNVEASKSEAKWNAALYIRLSKEDGDKEESYSVSNQRELLEGFVSASDINIFDIYIDDGYTGTNFDRPGFKRMMDDVKSKTINCIIVKDLSRFGRNYIEVGNYIEQIFPFFDVRFISVNDILDSYKNPDQLNNIIVPFKNLMNDEYSRDISIKVRSSLNQKKKKGDFIGSFAPYGYLKDPNNKNKLIIDESVAPIIRDIFNWSISGLGKITIAKKLNELGIPNPMSHKKDLGLKYRLPRSEKYENILWFDSSVARILKNEVYIGNMVQSKLKVKSYKVQKLVHNKEKDWVIVENTHEPIITIETWNKVQELHSKDLRVSPKAGKVHLLAGLIRCFDCGRAMHKKNISQPYATYNYYVCSTYKKMSSNDCTKHTIRSDKIEKVLLVAIQKQIELAVRMEDIISDISKSTEQNVSNKRLEIAINKKQAELSRNTKLKKSIYEDWKLGDLTREEYLLYKAQYEDEEIIIKNVIDQLLEEKQKFSSQLDENNIWITNFKKHKNITELNREIIVELVDKILVHEGGELTIIFKFADEFKLLKELIEENKDKVSLNLAKILGA